MTQWSFVALTVVVAPSLLLQASHAFNIQLSMKLGYEQVAAAPVIRRDFLKTAAFGLIGAGVGMGVLGERVERVSAAESLVDTYWGNGCFWHVQHEMIKAEREILGRSDEELTSYAGYAGARKAPKDDKLCYHNMRGINDYGKAGAGEVVRVRIPPSKVTNFAKAYFDLFVRYDNGIGRAFIDRRDSQDRGGEYRSLLGIPGGISGALFQPVKDEAAKRGIVLQEGLGGDPDTFQRNKVFVMDTKAFPFYRAEVYHQFHDDMTEFYGVEYNSLRRKYIDAGKIEDTDCPTRFF